MRNQEILDNSSDAVLARFKKLKEAWPYDISKPLTKEQEEAEGAVDVTDAADGLGLMILGVERPKRPHP